ASIARGAQTPDDRAGRFAFFMPGAVRVWVLRQMATIAGALIGNTIPKSVPLDFAIPLVFLALLMPTITSWPAAIAAIGGGGAAVLSAELGAHSLSILVGAVVGIAAGALAEARVAQP